MEGIYLIFVMVITGGAIAFIGDKLGTKIGKKRLSIMGLRPRHTSMIVTVLTGSLITALSIGFMVLISQNVRTALFGMDELRATMNSTLKELDDATENLFKAQTEFEKANDNLRESKQEIAALKTEQEELQEESARLKEGNERLETTNAELSAQNENLSATNATLEDDNQKLSEFNVTLTSDNEKLSANNERLTTDNEKLVADNSNLEERNSQLREGIIAIREGDITLRAGEILSSGVIKSGRSDDEISDDIKALANVANDNLTKRFGAESDVSIWIYQPELHNVIEQLAKSNQDMVLRIAAAGNLVRGEPVRTKFELYPNELIFGKDELILTKIYNVNDENTPEIILRSFLSDINGIAVEKGVLSDPLSGSVGVMEGTQIYEIFESLIDVKGKVELTAYARDKTDSSGPLRLKITLKQVL
ncbi:MAG: DUF3084 domain-containing protein [Selenomonadaceae bacterium]|nr:DUF3084 domain-containing protein [Selenomonadaceae bacterium]